MGPGHLAVRVTRAALAPRCWWHHRDDRRTAVTGPLAASASPVPPVIPASTRRPAPPARPEVRAATDSRQARAGGVPATLAAKAVRAGIPTLSAVPAGPVALVVPALPEAPVA